MTGPVKVRTQGLSNKLVPAVLVLLAGFALVLVGEREIGLSVVLAAVGVLVPGWAMPADRQTRG